MTKKDRWMPLRRGTYKGDEPPAAIAEYARREGITLEEARARLDKHAERSDIWLNDIYQVMRTDLGEGLIQLNIRRRDGKPIFRDWRHFQRIKNELVGEECEGVELYPAESRLTDTSNKYHIWCNADPKYRFPFGFEERDVEPESTGPERGLRQRRIP